MAKKPKNNNIPEHIRLGRNPKSLDFKAPKDSGGQGKIITNFQEISWTSKKLTITIVCLSLPFLLAVVISFAVGNYLIGSVFIGLGLLVLGMYWLLRYIDRVDW